MVLGVRCTPETQQVLSLHLIPHTSLYLNGGVEVREVFKEGLQPQYSIGVSLQTSTLEGDHLRRCLLKEVSTFEGVHVCRSPLKKAYLNGGVENGEVLEEEAVTLGIQPRVKSLRSPYTGMYPQTPVILHGDVSSDSGHPTRGCSPRVAV